MNAVATPSETSTTRDQKSIRQWIAELTDFTPQQIEVILSQMEQESLLKVDTPLDASLN